MLTAHLAVFFVFLIILVPRLGGVTRSTGDAERFSPSMGECWQRREGIMFSPSMGERRQRREGVYVPSVRMNG